MKITTDNIISTAKSIGTGVLYGLVVSASKVAVEDVIDMMRYRGNVKYSDAVDVIMSSGMFSSDKNRAIAALKNNKDADYYRAVIKVVKSNMFPSDKIRAITNLSEEEAE